MLLVGDWGTHGKIKPVCDWAYVIVMTDPSRQPQERLDFSCSASR